MGVPVRLAPSFSSGTPIQLLDGPYLLGGPGRAYDLSPDGERFLMITEGGEQGEAGSAPHIVVVLNWFSELRRLVPGPA